MQKSPDMGRLQGLCGPVDKPTRESYEGGFFQGGDGRFPWCDEAEAVLLNDTIHISGFGGEDMLWSWMQCPKLIPCSITAELLCLGRECGFLILWPSRWKNDSLSSLRVYTYLQETWWLSECCKPTHSNLCFTSSSHHHPSTLVLRARMPCDRGSFHGKAVFPMDTSVRMATVTNQIKLLSCQASTALAGCCPSTTSSWLASHQGKYVVSFDQSRIT
jgi:hypothetical protein